MTYQVSSLTVNTNDQAKWSRLHQANIRRKADAIALADAQSIRTVVNVSDTTTVIHDNGKPHGGKPCFLRNCPCPMCTR